MSTPRSTAFGSGLVAHPTPPEVRAARANQERCASYVTHCGWCSGHATGPNTTTGMCPTCTLKMEQELMLDRDKFFSKAIDAGVPPFTAEGLTRYVYERMAPGGFLRAVLENDLEGAIRRVDADNLAALPALCRVLHNEVPMGWYGTPGSVKAHLETRSVA